MLPTTDHTEKYDVDLDNEDRHGEYLVGLCTDEKIGKKTASCIVVCRPNTHPDDVPLLKATFTADNIIITGPAKSKSYVVASTKSDGWLATLDANKNYFQADKLVTTLTSMMTKFKKKERLKATHLSVAKLGIELSSDHFNAGVIEGELKMIPLPYTYTAKVGNKNNVVTEVMCIWRAYIEDSEQEIEEDVVSTSEYDFMVKMMTGNVI